MPGFNRKNANQRYQDEDKGFLDYQLFRQFGVLLRGPEWSPTDPADYNIVGSARVFGRYQKYPFTDILSQEYNIVARNIGYAGCVPSVIYNNSDLIHYLKTSPATPIIQVGAGDGATCDWFVSAGHRSVRLIISGAAARNVNHLKLLLDSVPNRVAYAKLHGMTQKRVLNRLANGGKLPLNLPMGLTARGGRMMHVLARHRSPELVYKQVQKCQDWIYNEYAKLAQIIGRPCLLLYFNSKELRFMDEHNFMEIVTEYPQYFDRHLLQRVASLFQDTIVSVSSTGMPYLWPGSAPELTDKYPSAEMHQECAAQIADWHASR